MLSMQRNVLDMLRMQSVAPTEWLEQHPEACSECRAILREAVSGQFVPHALLKPGMMMGTFAFDRHIDDMLYMPLTKPYARRSWVRQCLLIGMSPATILRLNKERHHHAYMLQHNLPTLRAAETEMEVRGPLSSPGSMARLVPEAQGVFYSKRSLYDNTK